MDVYLKNIDKTGLPAKKCTFLYILNVDKTASLQDNLLFYSLDDHETYMFSERFGYKK